MKALSKNSNDLQILVENNRRKKQKNQRVDAESLNFPKLSEDFIRNLTFGVYQLKQSKSYTQEHLNDDGEYEYEFIDYEKEILRVKINSRHKSQTIYNTFIKYSSDINSPIGGWYCDCRAGARVVGCCAHVASIIWFLGVGLYNSKLLKITRSGFYQNLCIDASERNIKYNLNE